MPTAAPRPCNYPGCGTLVHGGGSRCAAHKVVHQPVQAKPRSSTQQGYGYKWQQARAAYLVDNPLCVECMKRGIYTRATVVDHITPHLGDMDLFWRRSNWQPLCKPHHDRKTARENGGFGNRPRGGINL